MAYIYRVNEHLKFEIVKEKTISGGIAYYNLMKLLEELEWKDFI
jgi:hypothetical protein